MNMLHTVACYASRSRRGVTVLRDCTPQDEARLVLDNVHNNRIYTKHSKQSFCYCLLCNITNAISP